MKTSVKKNHFEIIGMLILYMVYVVCLFWFHPFVASAAEPDAEKKSVPGGMGNKVVIDSLEQGKNFSVRTGETLKAKENVEIVAVVLPVGDPVLYYQLSLKAIVSNSSISSVNRNFLDDCAGVYIHRKGDEIYSQYAFGLDNIVSLFSYKNGSLDDRNITCTVSGCKIFVDSDGLKAYVETGSLDGMLHDLDDGELDKEIGYIHDLKHLPLMYGEKDENGLYASYDDRFTWSDYYPEYDDSYLVEVRASCEVEVRKWFGIGKSTIYNSNIRELARDVRYKDLEYIVSLADECSVFSDFLNEYMPGNSSVSDVISAATYQFDAYYFRIYRWDEEAQTYKHGLWVRLTKDGTALEGSLDHTVDAGDIDDDGNWNPDPGSDYGDGKPGSATPGSGGSQDDAKEDADENQDEKDNGDHQIDLSDTNFKELWEWFTGLLITFWEGLGVIPDFFGRIFSFLPSPVIGGIGIAIVAAIILRIIGR